MSDSSAGKYYNPKTGYVGAVKKPGSGLGSDAENGGGGNPMDANESNSCKGLASPGLSEQRARRAQKQGGSGKGY